MLVHPHIHLHRGQAVPGGHGVHKSPAGTLACFLLPILTGLLQIGTDIVHGFFKIAHRKILLANFFGFRLAMV